MQGCVCVCRAEVELQTATRERTLRKGLEILQAAGERKHFFLKLSHTGDRDVGFGHTENGLAALQDFSLRLFEPMPAVTCWKDLLLATNA